MFKYSLFSLLRVAVYSTVSLLVSFWISVLWPQQLSMKFTISLLSKNAIDLLFFLEHKLYVKWLERLQTYFHVTVKNYISF